MAEVLLINPRARGKKKKSRTTRRRAKNRSSHIAGYYPNPIRKKRRRPKRRSAARRRRTFGGFRRNPIRANFLQGTLLPSAMGAAGALGVDVALGLLPLPAMLKTGIARPLVKGVAAVGLGMLAGMLTNRRTAEQVTAGALTVVVYDTAKTFLQRNVPALPLGEYDEYQELSYVNPAMITDQSMNGMEDDELTDTIGEYVEPGMGEYIESY